MKYNIYVDNASTSKIDEEVLSKINESLVDFYNPSSIYTNGKKIKRRIEKCRVDIAKIINAKQNEIIFTSCGTESNNLAIKGYLFNKFNRGYHIITCKTEHSSVLNTFKWLETMGFEVTYLDVNRCGEISVDSFRSAIKENTIFASIMLVNNEIGTLQNIKNLSIICHEKGIVLHTDAVQAVGHLDIDVDNLGCDMLSASAHKFNGPKGCGFLYKKLDIYIEPLVHGGQQELGLRGGTENAALIEGMTLALKKSVFGMEKNSNYIRNLRNHFIKKLQNKKIDFSINEAENVLDSIISISFKNIEGEVLLNRLELKGIYISTGSACDSKKTELSHVINALNIDDSYAYGTIRVSLSYENTESEIDIIADEISNIILKR